jgi:hypothetical protein
MAMVGFAIRQKIYAQKIVDYTGSKHLDTII